MEGISAAIGVFSLVLPAVTLLNSRVCKVVGEISETKRAAQDPKVLKQLREELATWGQVLQSIKKIKGSDGQLIVKATSHCKKYEKALLKTNKCLEQFRQIEVEDWGEITKILLKLNDLRKSHELHRKEVERWILSINTIMVNLTHEKLIRHEKLYSEASDAQAHKLESIYERLQGMETLLKDLSRDHNTTQQTERTSPVAQLAAITDDLRTICSQQIEESVVNMRTREEMCDSSCEEDASEVGSKGSLEGSSETQRQGSLTTRSQGTQTMLSYSNHDTIPDFADSNPTPTSSRFRLEEYSNGESAWDTDSRNECFSEIGSNSTSTTDHINGGVDVMDQARPEDDFDQYTESNTVLKKLESSTIKECKRVVAGSFGQATRGGPEVLTMDSEEWHKGVWERFWFSKGYTIGIAFERDWGPFQSDLGLAALSNACKFHHLVRRVSFITRKLDDFHDLRRGLVRGAGAFFAWDMAEGCPFDECKRNLDLLCAESLIRVGEDSSRWESTVFCITVPWRLYRFWTSVRERSGVGCLVDQGLLAEIPIKITGRDGQTWQRLWCPETVQGSGLADDEIRAVFHEFSLPKPCGSFTLPRRFIVVVYKTSTADGWVRSVYKSLNMDPNTQIHYLGSNGKFDPPFNLGSPS